jgi:hypothetical protein
MHQLVGVAAQRRGLPPSLPSRRGSSAVAIPHSTPLHEPEPQALTEPEPLIDQEKAGILAVTNIAEPSPAPTDADQDQAALKVQAIWRGKSGQKKAVEKNQAVLAGTQRVMAAKRTIRKSQVATMLLVMLATAAGSQLPNYVFGAAYGALANGEGIDRAIGLHAGLLNCVFRATVVYLHMELFALAMRDTPFVPGMAERILRPLVSGMANFLWLACWWIFLDLQNPENDIALIKGVPGAILQTVAAVLSLDVTAQPIELWRLYRSRNHKLPPRNVATWWQTTVLAGRGTLAAALSLCALQGLGIVGYRSIYLGLFSFFDKAGALASLPEGGFMDLWVMKYWFVIALPFMLLAVVWAKSWPPGARDPVSAVMLCTLQEASMYQVRIPCLGYFRRRQYMYQMAWQITHCVILSARLNTSDKS